MSELISMRQRIKAIQTIKKITQAMRLIALSSHARIKNKKSFMASYVQELEALYKRIQPENTFQSSVSPSAKDLVILLGSQKGLCGTFNIFLLYFFQEELHVQATQKIDIILIGKKIIDYFDKKKYHIIQSIPDLSVNKASAITKEITDYIWHHKHQYKNTYIVFNTTRRAIVATPQWVKVFPVDVEVQQTTSLSEAYYWPQEKDLVSQELLYRLLYAHVQLIIFESLSAEQITRFTSMNRSTKNASDLLDTMYINYNKLRQAKITRELTDLSASF